MSSLVTKLIATPLRPNLRAEEQLSYRRSPKKKDKGTHRPERPIL